MTVLSERCLVLAAASAVALVSARDTAGSWNDGSRLATVESLVDHHTLAIDDSVFVRPPPGEPNPYSPEMPDRQGGTWDRVSIGGHVYSHQPPVLALLMAGEYQVLKWCTGLTARLQPRLFCYFMTLGSSGLAYVVAVGCVHALALRIGLARMKRLSLPASLGLSTVALAYARQVNSHLPMLGVTAGLTLGLVAFAARTGTRPVGLGVLTGLGYALDLAAGPALLLCTLGLVAYRVRRPVPAAWFIAGTLPAVLLHHTVNYAVGGTFRPYGAVPEYLTWPGSAFDEHTMTGVYNHKSLLEFLTYGLGLLVGSRGFLNHNPPLLLAPLAAVALWRKRVTESPEIVWAAAWSGATWLVYTAFSNNYSGQCLSVRWLVPLLAPGFLVLALFLKHYPRYAWAFVLISVWGAWFAVDSWQRGPWHSGTPRAEVTAPDDPPGVAHPGVADTGLKTDSPFQKEGRARRHAFGSGTAEHRRPNTSLWRAEHEAARSRRADRPLATRTAAGCQTVRTEDARAAARGPHAG
jgi:hypothetical protein